MDQYRERVINTIKAAFDWDAAAVIKAAQARLEIIEEKPDRFGFTIDKHWEERGWLEGLVERYDEVMLDKDILQRVPFSLIHPTVSRLLLPYVMLVETQYRNDLGRGVMECYLSQEKKFSNDFISDLLKNYSKEQLNAIKMYVEYWATELDDSTARESWDLFWRDLQV